MKIGMVAGWLLCAVVCLPLASTAWSGAVGTIFPLLPNLIS